MTTSEYFDYQKRVTSAEGFVSRDAVAERHAHKPRKLPYVA